MLDVRSPPPSVAPGFPLSAASLFSCPSDERRTFHTCLAVCCVWNAARALTGWRTKGNVCQELAVSTAQSNILTSQGRREERRQGWGARARLNERHGPDSQTPFLNHTHTLQIKTQHTSKEKQTASRARLFRVCQRHLHSHLLCLP